MGLLDGKVAIVTGAGRGIGREETLGLAREGAQVVVSNRLSRDDESGELVSSATRVAEEIQASGGIAVGCDEDVSDWQGAERLIARAIDEFGHLDVLVNNAGYLQDQTFADLTEDEWDESIRINLKGHAAPIHFASRYWRREYEASGGATRGVIINTASQAALFGRANRSAYCAAKGGVSSLTRALAHELSEYGVRCNAILPRARTRQTKILESESLTPVTGDFDPWSPKHVAPVVAWLASDRAEDINGQMFIVFGGSVWLVERSEVASQLDRSGGWTASELAEHGHELFIEHSSDAGNGPWPANEMLARKRVAGEGSLGTSTPHENAAR